MDFIYLATVTDKQVSLVNALKAVWKDIPHQYCQAHYLEDAVGPLYEADEHMKTQMRKQIPKAATPTMREALAHAKEKKKDGIPELIVTGLVVQPPDGLHEVKAAAEATRRAAQILSATDTKQEVTTTEQIQTNQPQNVHQLALTDKSAVSQPTFTHDSVVSSGGLIDVPTAIDLPAVSSGELIDMPAAIDLPAVSSGGLIDMPAAIDLPAVSSGGLIDVPAAIDLPAVSSGGLIDMPAAIDLPAVSSGGLIDVPAAIDLPAVSSGELIDVPAAIDLPAVSSDGLIDVPAVREGKLIDVPAIGSITASIAAVVGESSVTDMGALQVATLRSSIDAGGGGISPQSDTGANSKRCSSSSRR